MSIEEIFMIEIEGLSKTIRDYTTDNYIVSYAQKLEQLSYPEDRQRIILIINRLKEWYEEYLPEIRSNKYIHNLRSHEKSYEILSNLENQL